MYIIKTAKLVNSDHQRKNQNGFVYNTYSYTLYQYTHSDIHMFSSWLSKTENKAELRNPVCLPATLLMPIEF